MQQTAEGPYVEIRAESAVCFVRSNIGNSMYRIYMRYKNKRVYQGRMRTLL